MLGKQTADDTFNGSIKYGFVQWKDGEDRGPTPIDPLVKENTIGVCEDDSQEECAPWAGTTEMRSHRSMS